MNTTKELLHKKTPGKENNLVFPKTIRRWDEAIPLGNGLMGALIWGEATGLRFSLDRGDIWDNTPYEGIFKEEFSYPNMVKLAKEGNIAEIRRIFDAPYNHTLPSKLPAGKLIFHFDTEEEVASELDLSSAEAHIRIGENIRIDSIVHARCPMGLIRIAAPESEISYEIQNPEYGLLGEKTVSDETTDSVNTASLKQLKYPAPEIRKENDRSFFIQEIGQGFSYGVFLMERKRGSVTEIVYTVAASTDGEGWKEQAMESLKAALDQGYETMLESHRSWWKEYWEESSITLPNRLFEKNWYLTQYFLGSCSRKGFYPMPLQGVWTADDGALPPWKGDYHFDLNVQMSYNSYRKANHLPEGEALIDYLWKMRDCARDFARTFYHSRGLCLPSVMTQSGLPLGGWGMYSLSPANQLWTCQLIERHYEITGDREFLEEKAYPYLKEMAEFFLDLLEEKDGFYYLPISSSPEIHDDTLAAFVTPNSNYDLALLRYLFGTLQNWAGELENEEASRWSEVLAHLPQLAVNEKGVLRICPDEDLKESHRHHSHTMSIYPLHMLPYEGEENRRIIDATIQNLEELGTGAWVGFSYTWMAELYAVQRNGNGAAFQLETFWRNHCSVNGFHLNGDYKKRGTSSFHYRPFTLEGNFCAADALQEMLLQSEKNQLRLFPAIPEEWLEQKLAFTDFRAERGLLVSAVMENGTVTALKLKAERPVRFALKLDEKLRPLAEKMGWTAENKESWIQMELKENEEKIGIFC